MYKVGRSRTPQGVRGLKQMYYLSTDPEDKVALRKECVD